MKIAAIQLNAIFADIKSNLEQAENYIREAVYKGAELVLLPEFSHLRLGFQSKCLVQ